MWRGVRKKGKRGRGRGEKKRGKRQGKRGKCRGGRQGVEVHHHLLKFTTISKF